jgi:hypothetical protein
MGESTVETDPGYGFLEEGMAVEDDHMGEGALRFTLVGLLFLIIAIVVTIKWAQHEGHVAAQDNAVYEPSPLLRQMEAQAADKLNHYNLLDPENGRYQIPIERAMTIIATEQASKVAEDE